MLDKKCLYRERIEGADSIARMDKMIRNRFSTVGVEQDAK